MSLAKAIIIGNLGKEPDLRYTPQGVAVCDFSVAVNSKKDDKPLWVKVTVWRQQAENASKYLKKGSPVYIEGRLSLEEWTDRDGNTRQTLSVAATDMHFLGKSDRGDAYEPETTGGDAW